MQAHSSASTRRKARAPTPGINCNRRRSSARTRVKPMLLNSPPAAICDDGACRPLAKLSTSRGLRKFAYKLICIECSTTLTCMAKTLSGVAGLAARSPGKNCNHSTRCLLGSRFGGRSQVCSWRHTRIAHRRWGRILGLLRFSRPDRHPVDPWREQTVATP